MTVTLVVVVVVVVVSPGCPQLPEIQNTKVPSYLRRYYISSKVQYIRVRLACVGKASKQASNKTVCKVPSYE